MVTDLILLSLRCALAAVFAAASLAKLRDRGGFRGVLLGFGLPAPATATLAYAIPLMELLVAAALALAVAAQGASLVAAVLLLVFTIAVAAALATGRRPSCGCFGGSRAIGPHTLARNAALLVTALIVAIRGGGATVPVSVEVTAATTLVLGVLSIASYQLLRRRGEELLRRDALAQATAEAAAPVGTFAGVVALAAAGAAAARPADDRAALRSILATAGPQLVSAAKRSSVRLRGQPPGRNRAAQRAATAALAAQRAQLLDVRARLLALQIQDPRAENARRLAAESLALFAASLSRVEAASGATPKVASQRLSEAKQSLEDAIYRGNRAALLLAP